MIKGSIAVEESINKSRKIRFIDNDVFYIDAGARISLKLGGEYVRQLKKVSASTGQVMASYTSDVAISCWGKFRDTHDLAVSLVNGDLLIFDENLVKKARYTIGHRSEKCVAGSKGQVWLGTRDAGVLYIDLLRGTVSNTITSSTEVIGLSVSDDENFVGVIKGGTGGQFAYVYRSSKGQ